MFNFSLVKNSQLIFKEIRNIKWAIYTNRKIHKNFVKITKQNDYNILIMQSDNKIKLSWNIIKNLTNKNESTEDERVPILATGDWFVHHDNTPAHTANF